MPTRRTARLTHNILADASAIAALKSAITNRQLDISAFYADPSQRLDELVARVSTTKHHPRVFPVPSSFEIANNKMRCWQLLKEHNIPIPLGDVCTSRKDIEAFHRYAVGHAYDSIIVKAGHRNHYVLTVSDGIRNLPDTIVFPVLVEVVCRSICSPVSQAVVWRGEIHHLFTLAQSIAGFHFFGDVFPSGLSIETEQRIVSLLNQAIELFPDPRGIFGADFIVTPSDRILLVDINPRFNSSTYPFYYLLSDVCREERRFARYRIMDCVDIPTLSFLHKRIGGLSYHPGSGVGILLFNPVIDYETGLLGKLSYLAVGRNAKEQRAIEEEFLGLASSVGPMA